MQDGFGEVLDYYPDDYVNSRTTGVQNIKGLTNTSGIVPVESYAGNIKAMTWYSKKPNAVLAVNPNAENPTAYVFNYDDKYQFQESSWATGINFNSNLNNFTRTSFNKESVINPNNNSISAYDANGNILYLQRTDGTGNYTDQFTYNYASNSNQLTSIDNQATGVSQVYASYNYDNLGQLTSEQTQSTGTTKYLQYDVTGKVTLVSRDAAFTQKAVEYVYDETGQRIIKKSYNTSGQLSAVTYYAEGAVYDYQIVIGSPVLSEIEYDIDGGGRRLGTYYLASNMYAYELTDHLGNVRSIVAKSPSSIEIRMYSDYYPYGMVIQDGGTTDYRHGYQGQYSEKDPETDWNAFELRMYDSRIARWLSIDPEGEFWSPYVAMGNEPIGSVDPNGGCVNCSAEAETFASQMGSEVYKNNKGTLMVNYLGKDGETMTRQFIPQSNNTSWYHFFRNDGIGGQIAEKINIFNPLANFVNGITGLTTGKEWATGQKVSSAEAALTLMATLPIGRGESLAGKPILNALQSRVFEVGEYKSIRGVEAGLDAHHVGQKALMSKFIPGYNSNTAPAILVPQIGHTQGVGVLLRNTSGLLNARQILARDIFELRRVYSSIPNSSLQQLIEMNKTMYPSAFLK